MSIASIDEARAHEWQARLLALAEESAAEPVGGDTIHTLVVGIAAATSIDED